MFAWLNRGTRTLWNQVANVAAEDGSDAEQVTVSNVGPAHLDALIGGPRDVGRQEDLLLTQAGVTS